MVGHQVVPEGGDGVAAVAADVEALAAVGDGADKDRLPGPEIVAIVVLAGK